MDLKTLLAGAREDISNALAALSNGDMFAAGAHYRAASDKLEAVSDLPPTGVFTGLAYASIDEEPGLGF